MATDYTMDDETWNSRKSKVTTYMDSHKELAADMVGVINYHISQGDAQPENRKRYWTAITTLFGMLDDSPITRGRQSDLPDEIQQTINDECSLFGNAHAALFASETNFNAIIRKHGKSGGGEYDNGEEYGETQAKSLKTKLTRYYRNYLHMEKESDKYKDTECTWDGSRMKNGSLNIVSPVNTGGEEEEE